MLLQQNQICMFSLTEVLMVMMNETRLFVYVYEHNLYISQFKLLFTEQSLVKLYGN